jgi:hypothetical protein
MQLLFFTSGVILINILTFSINNNWKINFAVMLILSGALALIIKLLNIKSIIKIAKYGE